MRGHLPTARPLRPPADRRAPASHPLGRLVRHVRPVLRRTGELRAVNSLLTEILQAGNGAVRQRRALQRDVRPADVVAVLSRHTGQDCLPETAA
ncbi:hypothetical protein [Saccharothrix lopnurensis]|uniref:Uncharacterized protein n=1 Tax=Saccharothrix lopnurensis TaxID=1670621 RepID=A0ABW1P8F8_9PSEU